MTKAEFNIWRKEFFAAFPALANWVAKLPDISGTLATWAITLDDIPIGVARAVTRRMLKGDLQPIDKWERESTALTVRGHAMRMLEIRRQRAATAKERELFLASRRGTDE